MDPPSNNFTSTSQNSKYSSTNAFTSSNKQHLHKKSAFVSSTTTTSSFNAVKTSQLFNKLSSTSSTSSISSTSTISSINNFNMNGQSSVLNTPINPFEETNKFRLEQSVLSPNIFHVANTSTPERDTTSLWNIDQRAVLYPADIPTDESSLIAQYIYDSKLNKQVSAAVEAFWSQNKIIIESPLANGGPGALKAKFGSTGGSSSSSGGKKSHIRSIKKGGSVNSPLSIDLKQNFNDDNDENEHKWSMNANKTTTNTNMTSNKTLNNNANTNVHKSNNLKIALMREQSCQTMLSIPLNFDLSKIEELKPFFVNTHHQRSSQHRSEDRENEMYMINDCYFDRCDSSPSNSYPPSNTTISLAMLQQQQQLNNSIRKKLFDQNSANTDDDFSSTTTTAHFNVNTQNNYYANTHMEHDEAEEEIVKINFKNTSKLPKPDLPPSDSEFAEKVKSAGIASSAPFSEKREEDGGEWDDDSFEELFGGHGVIGGGGDVHYFSSSSPKMKNSNTNRASKHRSRKIIIHDIGGDFDENCQQKHPDLVLDDDLNESDDDDSVFLKSKANQNSNSHTKSSSSRNRYKHTKTPPDLSPVGGHCIKNPITMQEIEATTPQKQINAFFPSSRGKEANSLSTSGQMDSETKRETRKMMVDFEEDLDDNGFVLSDKNKSSHIKSPNLSPIIINKKTNSKVIPNDKNTKQSEEENDEYNKTTSIVLMDVACSASGAVISTENAQDQSANAYNPKKDPETEEIQNRSFSEEESSSNEEDLHYKREEFYTKKLFHDQLTNSQESKVGTMSHINKNKKKKIHSTKNIGEKNSNSSTKFTNLPNEFAQIVNPSLTAAKNKNNNSNSNMTQSSNTFSNSLVNSSQYQQDTGYQTFGTSVAGTTMTSSTMMMMTTITAASSSGSNNNSGINNSNSFTQQQNQQMFNPSSMSYSMSLNQIQQKDELKSYFTFTQPQKLSDSFKHHASLKGRNYDEEEATKIQGRQQIKCSSSPQSVLKETAKNLKTSDCAVKNKFDFYDGFKQQHQQQQAKLNKPNFLSKKKSASIGRLNSLENMRPVESSTPEKLKQNPNYSTSLLKLLKLNQNNSSFSNTTNANKVQHNSDTKSTNKSFTFYKSKSSVLSSINQNQLVKIKSNETENDASYMSFNNSFSNNNNSSSTNGKSKAGKSTQQQQQMMAISFSNANSEVELTKNDIMLVKKYELDSSYMDQSLLIGNKISPSEYARNVLDKAKKCLNESNKFLDEDHHQLVDTANTTEQTSHHLQTNRADSVT